MQIFNDCKRSCCIRSRVRSHTQNEILLEEDVKIYLVKEQLLAVAVSKHRRGMDYMYSVLVCSTLFLSLALVLCLNGKKWGKGTKNLPPGPPGWPLLGNIFDLGTVPHQTLQELKLKYGPVLRLRLGSMETVVIQSAKAAAELFKNHDANFCDRKCLDVLTSHNYRDGSLAVGQFSPYWRMLRRLCSMEMMSNKRINETASIRRKCIDQMIR